MIQVQLKLRPTKAQERTFERWLWHLTGVWNWCIRKIEADAQLRIYHSVIDLQRLLNGHSQRIGIPVKALRGTVKTARLAWVRCFDGLARRPRLKGRRRPLSSIAFDQVIDDSIKGTRVLVPGIGWVRFFKQDIPDGRVSSMRLVKRASGWYACLVVRAAPVTIPAVGESAVGIDPGFSSLLTLSTGEKIEHPHEWRQHETRIGQAQRGRRTKLTARLGERVRNRRKNRNHHLSRRLVAENAVIAFSADSHRNIARMFGKSVASAGHYQLRQMLAYKSLAGGRTYIEVASRNSTRRCSACGALAGPTGWHGLKVRDWDCGACGAHHDRDVNAAVNTLRTGLGTSHESVREGASGIAS